MASERCCPEFAPLEVKAPAAPATLPRAALARRPRGLPQVGCRHRSAIGRPSCAARSSPHGSTRPADPDKADSQGASSSRRHSPPLRVDPYDRVMTGLAAVAACVILAALAGFQVALAAGVPWGRLAWGGQHPGVLPRRLRVGSLASIVLYAGIATVILWRSELVASAVSEGVVRVAAWCVVGYFLLGTVLNAMSRSCPERNVMAPAAACLFLLSSAVALRP